MGQILHLPSFDLRKEYKFQQRNHFRSSFNPFRFFFLQFYEIQTTLEQIMRRNISQKVLSRSLFRVSFINSFSEHCVTNFALALPSPSPIVCIGVRTCGRAQLASKPKSFNSMGLPMGLRYKISLLSKSTTVFGILKQKAKLYHITIYRLKL